MRTVLELVRLSTEYLQTHGVDSARLDAELLLGHVLDMSRVQLYVDFDRPLQEQEISQYRELVSKRATGVPVAYLTGEREFLSLPFAVRAGVLIPRPETEHLVEITLSLIHDVLPPADRWVGLDVGVGSGAIAVSLLKVETKLWMWGCDVNGEALECCRQNAVRHGVDNRLHLVGSDVYDQIVRPEPFDIIVSNPPYIPTGHLADLPRDVRNHEPRAALDGGEDGLIFYRRLLQGAFNHLRTGGIMSVEIGADQGPAVQSLCRQTGLFENVAVHKDYANRDRVVTMVRSKGRRT